MGALPPRLPGTHLQVGRRVRDRNTSQSHGQCAAIVCRNLRSGSDSAPMRCMTRAACRLAACLCFPAGLLRRRHLFQLQQLVAPAAAHKGGACWPELLQHPLLGPLLGPVLGPPHLLQLVARHLVQFVVLAIAHAPDSLDGRSVRSYEPSRRAARSQMTSIHTRLSAFLVCCRSWLSFLSLL